MRCKSVWPVHILDAQISMPGGPVHPRDPRPRLLKKDRDRTAGDRQVQHQMVGDLSWAYRSPRDEEDLLPVFQEDAEQTCQGGF